LNRHAHDFSPVGSGTFVFYLDVPPDRISAECRRGEKIYEYDLDVTGMRDYGESLDAILSGKEKIPRLFGGEKGVSQRSC